MSNIGSEHFIGLAGSGAATGIGVGSYEWQVRHISNRVVSLGPYANEKLLQLKANSSVSVTME